MKDIYNEVLAAHTAPGQLFETKDVINDKGVTYKEYVHFPDSLRGFLDFGLLMEIKTGLFMKMKDLHIKKFLKKVLSLVMH